MDLCFCEAVLSEEVLYHSLVRERARERAREREREREKE